MSPRIVRTDLDQPLQQFQSAVVVTRCLTLPSELPQRDGIVGTRRKNRLRHLGRLGAPPDSSGLLPPSPASRCRRRAILKVIETRQDSTSSSPDKGSAQTMAAIPTTIARGRRATEAQPLPSRRIVPPCGCAINDFQSLAILAPFNSIDAAPGLSQMSSQAHKPAVKPRKSPADVVDTALREMLRSVRLIHLAYGETKNGKAARLQLVRDDSRISQASPEVSRRWMPLRPSRRHIRTKRSTRARSSRPSISSPAAENEQSSGVSLDCVVAGHWKLGAHHAGRASLHPAGREASSCQRTTYRLGSADRDR